MNFFTIKTLYDMLALVAWVGVCAALISGIEITLEHFGFLADRPVDVSDLPPPSLSEASPSIGEHV